MSTTTAQERADDVIRSALDELSMSPQRVLDIVRATPAPMPSNAMRTSAAVRHVREHYARRIAVKEAAALCRLSTSQFSRTFKAEQHLSFGEYVLRLRLWMALHRLAAHRALVKEVAYGVGFNDLSYFARSFKRYFGITPSAVRTMSAQRALTDTR